MLRTHGRFEYSPILRRAAFTWPERRRLAVYVALNLEHYAFGEGLTEDLVPGMPQPDVLNHAWRDYGNRVGAWRLLDLFAQLELPATVLVNSELYRHGPELIAAFRERGDEIAAHGRTNSQSQAGLPEPAERDLIATATADIARHEGKRPAGWLGPWIAETPVTPDLLHEAGYEYVLDWCADDQPLWLATRTGRILAIPYPQELNDSTAIVGRRAGASEFADMIVDQFDEMREQGTGQSLVMGIALHAYVIGQPFRLRQLRRALAHIARQRESIWLTTAGSIARHFALQESAVARPSRAPIHSNDKGSTMPMDLMSINRMDHDRFVAAFGAIFEHSPWVAERAHAARPFASIDALHAAMVTAVRQSSRETQLALLRAHPDLAGKEAQEGTMTRDSVVEQASAGLGLLTRAEMDRIAGLNAAYRAKHGFPFIIAVRHYTKAGILHEFNRRLASDSETERNAALEQVAAITRMRLGALIDEDAAPASAAVTAS